MNYSLTAHIHEEEGWFVALCPETGTCSQGRTIDEAISNLQEATELYLEEFPQIKITRSFFTTFEVTSCASQ